MGFTLSCLQCIKIHAFKLVLRSIFFYIRLIYLYSGSGEYRVQLHCGLPGCHFTFLFSVTSFLIFIFLFILPICMKSKYSYLSILPHSSCPLYCFTFIITSYNFSEGSALPKYRWCKLCLQFWKGEQFFSEFKYRYWTRYSEYKYRYWIRYSESQVSIVNKIFWIQVSILNKIFWIQVSMLNKIFWIQVSILNKILWIQGSILSEIFWIQVLM